MHLSLVDSNKYIMEARVLWHTTIIDEECYHDAPSRQLEIPCYEIVTLQSTYLGKEFVPFNGVSLAPLVWDLD